MHYFQRLEDKDFSSLFVDQIKISGYVVDTLEAAIWCLLNTNTYQDCVLKAVKLGEDTDSVAGLRDFTIAMKADKNKTP